MEVNLFLVLLYSFVFVLGLLAITMMFIPGMNIFFYLAVKLSYRKIRYESEYFRDILSYSPSEIYYIYHHNFDKNFFMDVEAKSSLISRFKKLFYINLLKMNLLGYVTIDFSDQKNFKIIKNDVLILEEEYQMIYNFLFSYITYHNEISLFNIYRFVEEHYDCDFFCDWDNFIKESIRERGLFYRSNFIEVYGDKIKWYYVIIVPILLLLSLFIYSNNIRIALFMFFTFLVFLICGYWVSKSVIKVYSNYTVYEYRKIKALKKFLKDFSIVEERSVEYIRVLDDYIVYASIFDMLDTKKMNVI